MVEQAYRAKRYQGSWWGGALLIGLAGSLLWVGGCGERFLERESAQDAGAFYQRARQEETIHLSLLSMARSHHRRASLYLRQEAQENAPQLRQQAQERALQELDAILRLPFDASFSAGIEALQDAWGRKARLLLQWKRLEEAERVIRDAIQRFGQGRASFYLAQLYQIQGQILEEQKQIDAALSAYQRSIAINKAVIAEAQKLLHKARPSATQPHQKDTKQPHPTEEVKQPSPSSKIGGQP